jgi:hypothetical protein
MIKKLYILIISLCTLVIFIIVDYFFYKVDNSKQLISISHLTNIHSPSLGILYYEPRFLYMQNSINPSYPQMSSINKMDFIYDTK